MIIMIWSDKEKQFWHVGSHLVKKYSDKRNFTEMDTIYNYKIS